MMAEPPRHAVPRPVRCDVTRLAIDSTDAFLLSQVDGHSTIDDLATVSGLDVHEVQRIVGRLRDVGAVEVPGQAPRKKSSKSLAAPRRPPSSSRTPAALDGSLVPRVLDRAKVTAQAVDAREAFVLAQVDGKTPVEDVASVTGLSIGDVMKILGPLIQGDAIILESSRGTNRSRPLGAVTEMTRIRRRTTEPPEPTRPRRPTVAPPSARPRRPSRKSLRALSLGFVNAKGDASRKAAPQDDVCELDAELTTRIDAMLQSVPTATLYELLNVPRSAPKKAIKRAYFEFAATLHPDRHFRKRLGLYKAKLHDLFVRLTSAHDVLVDQAARAMYDATLPPEPTAPPEAPAQPAPRYLSLPPAPAPAPPTRRKTSKAQMPRVPSVPPAKPDRGPPVSLRSAEPPLAAGPASGPVPSSEPLKRFFADKVGKSARDRANVFVDAAEIARKSGNFVSAAQNYALAVQACGAPELQVALADVTEQAREQTSERALKAAATAEKAASWDEAVLRYGKAYDAVPSASVAERLAHSLRMQGSDLRRAVKIAEDAVLRAPTNVVCRVTLGSACADAGLWARARGESERALSAAPRDAGALELAARVKGKG